MITLRKIRFGDNITLAEIIRAVFKEHGADQPGTVYTDPQTDHLFELFQLDGSICWVAEMNDEIMGCCGIYPTEGLPEGCVELVKLYLKKEGRGKGIGQKLMNKCFDSAKELKYKSMYIESLPQFSKAVSLYKSAGFYDIPNRLGNSGHFACKIWMKKEL